MHFLQVLRIQSADGTKRIETEPSSTTKTLYELVREVCGFNHFEFALFRERNFTKEVRRRRRRTMTSAEH